MEPRTYPLEESGQLLVDPRRIWATHMMLPALWQGPRRTRRYVYLLCQPIRPRALRGPAYDWYESNFPLMSWDPELFEAVELTTRQVDAVFNNLPAGFSMPSIVSYHQVRTIV